MSKIYSLSAKNSILKSRIGFCSIFVSSLVLLVVPWECSSHMDGLTPIRVFSIPIWCSQSGNAFKISKYLAAFFRIRQAHRALIPRHESPAGKSPSTRLCAARLNPASLNQMPLPSTIQVTDGFFEALDRGARQENHSSVLLVVVSGSRAGSIIVLRQVRSGRRHHEVSGVTIGHTTGSQEPKG